MMVKAMNIARDTDGISSSSLRLETTVDMDEDADLEYEIADALSDRYGFCVNNFTFELVD